MSNTFSLSPFTEQIREICKDKLSVEQIIFVDYCAGYYMPGQMYGEFFDEKLTLEELIQAVQERLAMEADFEFDGDTMDREIVRDILQHKMGKQNLEWITPEGKIQYTSPFANEKS